MTYQVITSGACGVIFICCLLGVFHTKFDDTFIQRVVFCLGAIFALGVGRSVIAGEHLPEAVHGLIGCVAIHCLEVVRKIAKRHKPTPADEFGKTTVFRIDNTRAFLSAQVHSVDGLAQPIRSANEANAATYTPERPSNFR